MFQDDRVMSILTGLVIVIAMAVLAQRSDSLAEFFTREEVARIAPQNDEVAVFAGQSKVIDVLANDENALPEDGANLRIVVSPSCGAAEATLDGVLYISNDRCVGPQLFAYCVARGDECASASVTVSVAEAPQSIASAAPAPQTRTPAVRTPAPASEPAAPAPSAASVPAPSPAPAVAPASPTVSPAAPASPTVPALTDTVDAAPSNSSPAVAEPVRVPSGDFATGRSAPVIAAVNPVAPTQPVAPRIGSQLGIVPDAGDANGAALSRTPLPTLLPQTDTSSTDTGVVDAGAGNTIPAPAAPQQIASLTAPDERTVNDRVQDEAVDQIRNAALPPSDDTSPVGIGCGPATMTSTAVSGGSTRITVNSPCRAGEPMVVQHAGLRFGGAFDVAGNAEIIIPIMDIKRGAQVSFVDGGGVAGDLAFNIREVELTLRVAVSWTAPIDLNLHAFEYASGYGGDGHVWQERPRGFRLVRQAGGGFLANFPATSEDGDSVEVYTFWANNRARRGTARIALEHASRGELPDGAFCGTGPLASPSYTVVQAERGEVVSTRRGRFAPARCGEQLTTELRYVSGALRDLEIE